MILNRLIAVVFVFVLAGCTRDINEDEYSAEQVGIKTEAYTGVVLDSTVVKIKEHSRTADNSTGMAAGALAGGLGGSMLGGGGGRLATTAVGATIGAVGGMFVEDKMSSQQGIRYVIRLDPPFNRHGGVVIVVQGKKPRLHKGQQVVVSWPRNNMDRARAIPFK